MRPFLLVGLLGNQKDLEDIMLEWLQQGIDMPWQLRYLPVDPTGCVNSDSLLLKAVQKGVLPAVQFVLKQSASADAIEEALGLVEEMGGDNLSEIVDLLRQAQAKIAATTTAAKV